MKRLKHFLYLFIFILALSCSRESNTDPNNNLLAPTVNFRANDISIYAGTAIDFVDLSTENPTNWSWTFQGGMPSASTEKNPTGIQYNTPGTYTVTLTSGNATGQSTKTKTGYIVVTLPLPILPTLTTTAITNITNTAVNTGGNITNQGSSAVLSRGICWSTSPTPTTANNKTINGSGIGSFTSSLTGLAVNTSYYVRAYASNGAGTAYGNELSFTTTSNFSNCGIVTDIDGNVYHTVTIGTQCWMQENLKTSHYNDGTSIMTGLSPAGWTATRNGAYVIYDNNPINNTIYGKLYNWYAVNTGKLAPTGWHVPTNAEWHTLISYLGGNGAAGIRLKSTNLWSSNTGNNSSGFTWLPGGARSWDGSRWAATLGSVGFYYTNEPTPFAYFLISGDNNIYISGANAPPNNGVSVRCVKN